MLAITSAGAPIAMILPGVEAHHPLRKAHHRLHDVLDHDDGDVLLAEADQEIEHLVDLRMGKPRHRLVRDQQLRPHRHRARKLHLAQFHLAQRIRRRAGFRCKPHPRQDRHRDVFLRQAGADGGKVEPDQEIFEYRHALERPRNLERPGDAAARAQMRRQLGNVLAAEHHAADLRFQRAGNAVDQRRLAGAVRPDQAEPFSFPDIDADIVERGEAAEGFGQGFDLQQGRFRQLVMACLPRAGGSAAAAAR